MAVVVAVVMVKLLGGAVHVSPCGMAKSAGYWGTTSAAILYLVVREVLRDRDFLHTGRVQPRGHQASHSRAAPPSCPRWVLRRRRRWCKSERKGAGRKERGGGGHRTRPAYYLWEKRGR
ncbi:hypothetical protein QYE76_003316 [Lolium multiflorum]|uniref:Uncharacterized protein n=1 Tax=Lolium multiflorum TaxID=4521 RepID=A0AAD8RNG8_LOLMU|nr:hypothetical protein QYE76_003316 [Lolium multiflorum]